MNEEIKERVSTLEVVLGEFIVQINKALKRMEEDTRAMKERMDEDTRVMKKEMNQRWGELANRLGTLAEDIAAPNLPTVAATYFQCEQFDTFDLRASRRNVKDPTVVAVFDVVLSCQQMLFICEVKSTAKKEYVDMFREQLSNMFDYFPNHQGKTVIPIMAALHMHESVLNYLTKHRIYAMAMGGETMHLMNYDAIQAKK